MKPKQNGTATPDKSQTIDQCQTPPYAIKPLVTAISKWGYSTIPNHWRVWEPAAGNGNLVKAFKHLNYDCAGTDILTGHNFFKVLLNRFDCIVTNPPYSIKYQWLARCYAIGKPFALLMPAETYFSGKCQALENQFGNLELIRFDRRINFHMPNIGWNGSSAQFPTAWFTFGFDIGQQVTSAELDRDFLSDLI